MDSRAPALVLLVGAAVGLMPLHGAGQDRDYDLDSDGWNGASELRRLATEEGFELRVPRTLDVTSVDPRDALLLVYPTQQLPVVDLARFVRAGGRVAVADDFGSGESLLGVYRVKRHPFAARKAFRFRGNRNLPVARPLARHPLTVGVGALVTNHPATLSHSALDPIFAYEDSDAGLVLAGAVGDGRLIAIGDPSLLINNMLEFADNRRFAANLLHYLGDGRSGRIHLIGQMTALDSNRTRGDGSTLDRLDRWLAQLARGNVHPAALLVFAIVLTGILLVVAMSSLPRSTPYVTTRMFKKDPGVAWDDSDLRLRTPRERAHTWSVYVDAFKEETRRVRGVFDATDLARIMSTARATGRVRPDLKKVRAFLHHVVQKPHSVPSRRQLQRHIHCGELILTTLNQQPALPAPESNPPRRPPGVPPS